MLMSFDTSFENMKIAANAALILCGAWLRGAGPTRAAHRYSLTAPSMMPFTKCF